MANLRVDKITSTETFETTGSVQFNGTDSNLELASGQVISGTGFGTNDFTIEFWLYPEVNDTNYTILFAFTSSTTTDRFEVAYHSSKIHVYTDTATWRNTDIEPDKRTWHHIAFVRDYSKSSLIMYVDGKNEWQVTNNRNYDEAFTSQIGSYNSGSYGFLQGFISNFRVVNGTALYKDTFKPPMRELEDIPGTALLCCQSKTSAITAKTGNTITTNGSPEASELTPGLLTSVPKAGGGSAIKGSVEFDAEYDGLVLSKSTDFQFGTGDFTIEGWFNVSDT